MNNEERLKHLISYAELLNKSQGKYFKEFGEAVQEIRSIVIGEKTNPYKDKLINAYLNVVKEIVGSDYKETGRQNDLINAYSQDKNKIEYVYARRGEGSTTNVIALMKMFDDVYYICNNRESMLNSIENDYLRIRLSNRILKYEKDKLRGIDFKNKTVIIDSGIEQEEIRDKDFYNLVEKFASKIIIIKVLELFNN